MFRRKARKAMEQQAQADRDRAYWEREKELRARGYTDVAVEMVCCLRCGCLVGRMDLHDDACITVKVPRDLEAMTGNLEAMVRHGRSN